MTPVIIGAGPAGMRLARRFAPYSEVLVLDGDIESPQATETRPQLLERLQPDYFQQDSRAKRSQPLLPLPAGIRLVPGRKAMYIDRKNRQVVDSKGQRHGYSHLFLALGAKPLLSELPGSQLAGVQTLYTRRQLDTLIDALAHKGSLLILGGGLLAVELAALVADRASVTLVARSRLLGRYLEPVMSARVAGRLKKLGVRVLEQVPPQRLLGSHDVTGLELADGRQLAAQQVVLACGIQPNIELARDAGLEIDDGILVNDSMRSPSDPCIFAVGDCAQPPWPLARGNIAQVLYQADLALATVLNEPPPASPPLLYQQCQLGGSYRLMMAASLQTAKPKLENCHHYRRGDHALCLAMRHRRVIAFQALLPCAQAKRLAEHWENRVRLSPWELASLRRLAWLPPRRQTDPVICHCANVRRSQIRAAIAEHGSEPTAICQATQAGRYCGSCIDDIAALSGGKSWRSRIARWLTVLALLLVGIVFGMLPVWSVPASVREAGFAIYRLMTDGVVREISGYLLTIAILLALAIRGGRRRYWWHILLGSLALLLLPLHSLGGVFSGAGLNAILVGLMLFAVASGALVMLRRRLAELRFGHLVATGVLLAATLLHVVFVYQY